MGKTAEPKQTYFIISSSVESAFRHGLAKGIERFAWWRDGIQYVGTSGMTLKEALDELGNIKVILQ